MNYEMLFLARLAGLAKLFQTPIDEEVIGFYDRALSPLGYQSLCEAIEKIASEGGGKFPSIAEIRKAVTGEPLPSEIKAIDESDSRKAASLIIAAASKYGQVLGSDAEKINAIAEFLGGLAWSIVQERGGWNFVCGSLSNDNLSTQEAQLRELAKSKLERRRRGVDTRPPELPSPSPRVEGLRPISAIPMGSLFGSSIGALLENKKGPPKN